MQQGAAPSRKQLVFPPSQCCSPGGAHRHQKAQHGGGKGGWAPHRPYTVQTAPRWPTPPRPARPRPGSSRTAKPGPSHGQAQRVSKLVAGLAGLDDYCAEKSPARHQAASRPRQWRHRGSRHATSQPRRGLLQIRAAEGLLNSGGFDPDRKHTPGPLEGFKNTYR